MSISDIRFNVRFHFLVDQLLIFILKLNCIQRCAMETLGKKNVYIKVEQGWMHFQ